MFYGLCFLAVELLLTGGLAVVATPTALKGRVGLLSKIAKLIFDILTSTCALVFINCWSYNVTMGAVAYTLLAETATSRLRLKTIAIGIFVHNAINVSSTSCPKPLQQA